MCVCVFLSPPSPQPSPSPTVSWGLRSLFSWKSGWIQFSLPSHMTSSSYSFTLPLLCPSLRPPLLLLYLFFTPRLFLLTVLICSLFFRPTLHDFPPLLFLLSFTSCSPLYLMHFCTNLRISPRGGKKNKTVKTNYNLFAWCKCTDVLLCTAGLQPVLQHSGGRLKGKGKKIGKGSSCMFWRSRALKVMHSEIVTNLGESKKYESITQRFLKGNLG